MAQDIGKTNGFDHKQVQSFVTRIQNIEGSIRSVKAKNAKECQDLQRDISDIIEEAKSAGIPKKELKAHLKVIELTDKINSVRDGLDEDQQEVFDQLAIALGPLGEAARAVYQAGE